MSEAKMKVTLDLQIACEDIAPDKSEFKHWAKTTLTNKIFEDCELSIRLVCIHEMTKLNFNYRKKSGPTNILSFPFEDTVSIKPKLLGDLIICNAVIEAEATQQHKQVDDHWSHLTIHIKYGHFSSDFIKLKVNIKQVVQIVVR